ncbi:MAG: NAD-dependent epimerase/dehydratase family protein [Candidatus Eremiobacteraeota bacterium]|nr:NAD-dependent epimerase/dehydratase family protein [Candidatus Eremiobacteraeota bacterium]
MRVLVAGGTGVLGAPTVRRLLEAGHDVTLLARPEHRATPAGVRVEIVDLCDGEAVREAVERVRPEAVVVHVSSLPEKIDSRTMAAAFRQNSRIRTAAGVHLARAAAGIGARTVFSGAAFWYARGAGLAEESVPFWFDAPEPILRTIWSLVEAETAVDLAHGVILRLGILLGPGTHHDRAGYIGKQIVAGTLPILGDGTGVTSFVHVEDVATATLRALGIAPGAYNVVDDEPAAARDWMPVFAAAYGGPPPKRLPEAAARLVFNHALAEWILTNRGASNAKLRATGWQPAFASWRATLSAS